MSTHPQSQKRREERIEFLGEQDGPIERQLKEELKLALGQFPVINRAYLARVGFAPAAPVSVALCVMPTSPHNQQIVEAVEKVFKLLFATSMHLDVVFLDLEQENDLKNVCRPFYE